jgi:hypothetical protein
MGRTGPMDKTSHGKEELCCMEGPRVGEKGPVARLLGRILRVLVFSTTRFQGSITADLSELGHFFGVKRRGREKSEARLLRFGDQCVTKAVCRTASFVLNCCLRWAEGTNWFGERRGRK